MGKPVPNTKREVFQEHHVYTATNKADSVSRAQGIVCGLLYYRTAERSREWKELLAACQFLNYSGDMAQPPESRISEPSFVSRQVAEARRYYLDLMPTPKSAPTVVCGGMERMQPDYVVQRDDFPFYAIEFVASGSGNLTLAGGRHPALEGGPAHE